MTVTNEPIALIGSGCRFPGKSTTPSKLWDLLKSPRDCQSKIDRFNADAFYNKNGHFHGSSNVLHSYLLEEDPKHFDAQFFSIPASEAESIDPQQRFLMEVVYESLESAGIAMEDLSGSSTACYVGVMCNDFATITYADPENVPKYAATGSALSILSNRLSYFFNWTGPSMTIDTACSSSLVAVHQAVQALRSGNSKVAVAAGTNLIFAPNNFIAESNVNMLSPTGRSRMWDDNADGYARGEGVGAVVLKTLSQAIADGDEIECIIRETGVNQDGRTPGITMPSSHSQSNLIRETYKRAGLDLSKQSDRPTFFEAHGTGTKAGDPQEASAIHRAFFEGDLADEHFETLYVGSIKTLVGHTEGTAGIAGLLKASLSVQNKIIAPNMLFETLNPAIQPYYGNLQVTTQPLSWPEDAAFRVSVNSFGFGGTNAHAIVERYEKQEVAVEPPVEPTTPLALPIVFSAYSEKALGLQMQSFLDYTDLMKESKIRDVAWSLSKRSSFALRASYAGVDLDTVRAKVEAALEKKNKDKVALGARPNKKQEKVLGVFTGQGAQWATMGAELLKSSSAAQKTLKELDESLKSLPAEDRPSWTIVDELSKDKKSSQVMEGEFSQPLCTAVQVVLVDLLTAAGVSFDAVVGHSSGEIGAAYAAGYLSAKDAIRIAYYRGKFGKLAHGRDNTEGAMLAAGTDMADAEELCALNAFKGKLQLAASNSSASVTLSGDAAAVKRAAFVLEDEKKFARLLKVDTAYHSYHMQPCSEPYMDAMARVGTSVQTPKSNTRWFSSVRDGEEVGPHFAKDLAASYWRDNLLNPVKFSQALQKATNAIDDFGLAIEVGPHAALKGPASLTIEEALGRALPYTGTLSRGTNDVEALTESIGYIWANSASTVVDFGKWDGLFQPHSGHKELQLLKDVPRYTWDHDRKYWKESRMSNDYRFRKNAHHELLGVRMDSNDGEYRWRNFISASEVPWMKGHQIQGQLIFPGAGFTVMAIEAARQLSEPGTIATIELFDTKVLKAMAFVDDNAETEAMCSLTNVIRDDVNKLITADFKCDTSLGKEHGFVLASTSHIKVRLGEQSMDALPARTQSEISKIPVETDDFYTALWDLGYNYADMFKSVTEISRMTDSATGKIHVEAEPDYETSLSLHPAPLDVAFQTIFAAMGAPGDGRLYTTLVPSRVKRITFNEIAAKKSACLNIDLPFDASVTISPAEGISGDADVYEPTGVHKIFQCEGLEVVPLSKLSENDDREMFCDTDWQLQEFDAGRGIPPWELDEVMWDAAYFVERACLFYLKQAHDVISPEERATLEWHPRKMLDWAAEVIESVEKEEHPLMKKEWLKDTPEQMKGPIEDFTRRFPDFESLVHVGNNLVGFARGTFSLMELVRDGGLLDHIYRNTYAFPEYNSYIGKLMKQLSHRFPRMDIFEIGAGTGSATDAIFKAIGHTYSTYTYTDISAGFFPNAQQAFAEHEQNMAYATFDVEKEASKQNIKEGSYDVVVASNVLHATKNLNVTLTNARKLLKPGGHLILLEVTNLETIRPTFFFGCLPGWWLGEEDFRPHHPLLTVDKWDGVLKEAGFSGVDSVTTQHDAFLAPFSVFISQNVDNQMSLIRQPMQPQVEGKIENLLILGGSTSETDDLVSDTQNLLQPYAKNIVTVESFEDIRPEDFSNKQLVLSYLDLDGPVLQPFTPERFKALQLLVEKSLDIVWVVKGSGGDNPLGNMMNGVARCLMGEKPDLVFQFIDYDTKMEVDAKYIAETMIRLHLHRTWQSFLEPYHPAWTLEREVRMIDGEAWIPRYLPSPQRNLQYNSWRRPIRDTVDPSKDNVEVAVQRGVCEYQKIPSSLLPGADAKDLVTVNASKSSLKAVEVPGVGNVFVNVGKVDGQSQNVVAFSTSISSKPTVHKDWVFPAGDLAASALIESMANLSIASKILDGTPNGATLLVHEAPVALAQIIKRQSKDDKRNIYFTTCKQDKALQDSSYIHLHSFSPDYILAKKLPTNIMRFADASGEDDEAGLRVQIANLLPAKCKQISLEDVFDEHSSVFVDEKEAVDSLKQLFERASENLKLSTETPSAGFIREVAALDLPGATISSGTKDLQVLDWQHATELQGKVNPIEDEVTFPDNKTYLLVGLSGELGRSLCHWMVRRGAKHIVLTSRKPKVEQAWLDLMSTYGATVSVLPMDVTSRRSVVDCTKKIKNEMPPVAGVCNGAMILKDGLVNMMSYEDFGATLAPKVQGTMYLDEVYKKTELDFFIVFSSLAYVTGNVGQTPYAAANGYMASIVEGRRKRGLAGSVMNLAGIFGIGYITRTDRGIIDRLGNMGYANISEYDFHQFFAEAVLAGPPDAGRYYEVSSAVKAWDPSKDANPPAWIEAPRFAYYKKVSQAFKEGGDGANQSVRAQLKDETSMEGVHKLLMNGLIMKLYKQLGLAPDDDSISPESSLVELGIDSLVAVDMRYWFTKELDLDMPVLKLLGGATVREMIDDTVERLSPDLIPNVKGDGAKEGGDSKPAAKPEPAAATGTAPKATGDIATQADSASSDGKADGVSSEAGSSSDDALGSGTATTVPTSRPPSRATKEVELPAPVEPLEKLNFVKKAKMGYGALQLYFQTKHLEDPTTLNMQFTLPMKGSIDQSKFEKHVPTLGKRHEALRTAFFLDPDNDDEPTQGVLAESSLKLEVMDVTDREHVEQITKSLREATFDIERAQTIRIHLLKLDPTTQWLVFSFHHIAVDGFSFNILLQELGALYEGKTLKDEPTQFSDVVTRQRARLENGKMKNELAFWKESLGDIPEPISLFPSAAVRNRASVTRYAFNEAEPLLLDAKTVQKVSAVCKQLKVTRFHFFMTVLRIYLFALTDVEELNIGFADANRTDATVDKTVGFLVNLLTLKFSRDSEQTFDKKLNETRKKCYAALANSTVPFNALLEHLGAPRSSTHSPIFQVLLQYLPSRISAPKALGVVEDEISPYTGSNFFDLVLEINDVGPSEVFLRFRMQKYLYPMRSVELLMKAYIRLLEQCVSTNLSETITNPEIFEKSDVQEGIKFAQGPVDADLTADDAVTRISGFVASTPDTTSVKDSAGHALTYKEMDARASQIASALATTGVKPQQCVALYLEPSVDTICSILAIWKLGATYVPLDCSLPVSRLAKITEDCRPAAIVGYQINKDTVTELKIQSRGLVELSTLASGDVKEVPDVKRNPNDVGVILYTSGSTGTPKGLPIRHISLINQIGSMSKNFGVGAETVLHQSAASFDVAMQQILMGLCNGGTVHVASREERMDPATITKVIADQKITWVHATPSEYAGWLRQGSQNLASATSLKTVFSSGEALTSQIVDGFRKLTSLNIRLVNVYGPAEAGVITGTEVDLAQDYDESKAPVPIGKPLANIGVYIVDNKLKPVPVGVKGEIVIAGAGNIQQYLKRPDLSKEAFVGDVITPAKHFPGQLAHLYRSGDLGRYDENGVLFYEGRIANDTQVKISGIRIELQDIENTILETADGAITSVVAVVRRNPDFIIAWAQFAEDFPEDQRKDYLSQLQRRLPLPKYMRPAMLYVLQKMPLTPHGKLDRRTVNEMELPAASASGADAQLNDMEAAVRSIWIECLPDDIAKSVTIGKDTDFFALGGNSFLLVRLRNLVRQQFQRNVQLLALYDASSLSAMAYAIQNSDLVATVDWEKETTVSSDIKAAASPAQRKTKDLCVVLTGSTGFVGKRVLQTLNENENVSKIHCVAIREHTKSNPRELAAQSDKITAHGGGMEKPMLGMTSSNFAKLADQVDLIIHCGANRSFWDDYNRLRGPNVTSTKSLVDMAAKKNVPIHFVSSGGINLMRDSKEYEESSVSAFPPPIDGSNGYISSKWASEVYLENAAKQLGVPVFIHRMTPASKETEEVPSELIEEVMGLAKKMRSRPTPGGWQGSFDLTPVGDLANDFVSAMLNGQTSTSKDVTYMHHEAQVKLSLDTVFELMEMLPEREEFEEMAPLMWAGTAKKMGLTWHFASTDFATGAKGVSLQR